MPQITLIPNLLKTNGAPRRAPFYMAYAFEILKRLQSLDVQEELHGAIKDNKGNAAPKGYAFFVSNGNSWRDNVLELLRERISIRTGIPYQQ